MLTFFCLQSYVFFVVSVIIVQFCLDSSIVFLSVAQDVFISHCKQNKPKTKTKPKTKPNFKPKPKIAFFLCLFTDSRGLNTNGGV